MQGATETTFLNGLVQEGAAARLADREFLEREIRAWKLSRKRRTQITGERYYGGKHDILWAKRQAVGRDGKLTVVENLPNCRIVDNQYAKMVDQKVNYLLGKPLTFDTENSAYAAALGEVFNSRFYRTLRALGEDSLNGGIGWLYPHYDPNGAFCLHRFESYEILPFWADEAHTILDAAVRLYEVEAYEGRERRIIEYVEVYLPAGVYRYRLSNGTVEAEAGSFSPYLLLPGPDGAERPYGWARVPLVAFKYNNKETPLILRVKSLQDGINRMLSTFENNMLEDARNTILVVVNAEGTDPGEFRQNLAAYGMVKVVNRPDMPNGDVRALAVEVNCENYRSILELFKKALIENARGYDAKDDRLAGNPNQMNLLSMYSDIDLDANGMETEYQASFEELLWFVNAHLANTGRGDFRTEKLRVLFNRDVMMNASEQVAQCKDSTGLVSSRTILAHHPFVTDVEKELRQLEEEAREADSYAGAFPRPDGSVSRDAEP